MTGDAADDEIENLLDDADIMLDGPEKLAVLERAARLADSKNLLDSSYEIRNQIITTATFGGYPEKAILAFAWCRAQADKDPEKFQDHEWELLWQYKWIIERLPGFPQYSMEQMEEMLLEMERRYKQWGAGERSIAKSRCIIAQYTGQPEKARELMEQWKKLPVDDLSDCPACDASFQVEIYSFLGEHELANEAAEGIFNDPKMTCEEVPDKVYSKILLSLYELGQIDQATKYQKKGYRLNSKNPGGLFELTCDLTFLVLINKLTAAGKIIEKHLIWALDSKDVWLRMQFFIASMLFFKTLKDQGKTSIKLRLPRTFVHYREDDSYDAADMAAKLEHDSAELAKAFDRRDKNNFYQDFVAAREMLRQKSLTGIKVK